MPQLSPGFTTFDDVFPLSLRQKHSRMPSFVDIVELYGPFSLRLDNNRH